MVDDHCRRVDWTIIIKPAEAITAAPAMELRSNHAGPAARSADKQMACARLPTGNDEISRTPEDRYK